MQRHKWETAIRCLEVALHPGTGDDEVIAAVNGFRRTAGGTPLGTICGEFAGKGHEPLDRLSRENLELRRKLEAETSERGDTVRRLSEAEQQVRGLSDELLAAQRRAAAAERRLAEFRAAYVRAPDGLGRDDVEHRRALGQAGFTAPHRAPEPAIPPFQKFLAAAQRGTADGGVPRRPAAPGRGPETHAPPVFSPRPRAPWTA